MLLAALAMGWALWWKLVAPAASGERAALALPAPARQPVSSPAPVAKENPVPLQSMEVPSLPEDGPWRDIPGGGSESSRDLGFGFRQVKRQTPNPPGHWEGIYHSQHLYYRDRELCSCASYEYSISPSGSFALYAGGVRGERMELMLFAPATGIARVLGLAPISPFAGVAWEQGETRVRIEFLEPALPDGKRIPPPLRLRVR
ncbi:hypothetical protein [Luteimonas aquatica]|uniref:hypothetical protein n=1 Tax=Luteimonas aquatica TaxID=450364 RepID=UPI001F5897CF|nr:hypothetical protein [Luteimonas aquatica]